MSQHELVDLWLTSLSLAMTVFVAFLSATSAYLIVAHFKGKELQRSLYRIVTALYCVSAIFFLAMYAKTVEGALDIRDQARILGLDWFNIVYEPQALAPTTFTIGFIVQILLAAGSIWYFRSTRRQ